MYECESCSTMIEEGDYQCSYCGLEVFECDDCDTEFQIHYEECPYCQSEEFSLR